MMNSLPQIFRHDEFGTVDVLMIGDKPHFPAAHHDIAGALAGRPECARILGYGNPNDAIISHCRSIAKREVPHPQSPGKTITVNYIPEGDLYRLIARSRLPAAVKFESWIFDTVVPSIRKHGAYVTDNTLEKILADPDFGIRLLQNLKTEKEKSAALQKRADELAPKARYYDMILQSKNAMQVSLIAKDYGMSAVAFNKLLKEMRIQFKSGDTWVLYQKYAGMGYTKSRTYQASEYMSVVHTYWTQRGRLFLYNKLKEAGIVPLMEAEAAAGYGRDDP